MSTEDNQVLDESYEAGWFKVSRRLLDSSRWWKETPEAIKVLIFLLAKAQDPLNPVPGTVYLGETAIAGQTGLPVADVRAAVESLTGPDDESRTKLQDGCTLARLPNAAGFRFLNFELYHPGRIEKADAKREMRSARARKAAEVRWSCDACGFRSATQASGGRRLCDACAEEPRA